MPRFAAHALALCVGLASFRAHAREPSSYVVRPGDTLGRIAKRFGVSVQELRRANGLKPGQRILPRERLVLPRHGTADSTAKDSTAKGDATAYASKPRRPGYVTLTGARGNWSGLARADGGISEAAKRGFEDVLAFWKSGDHHAVDSHLIELLVDVSDHFGGRALQVVSGYRPYSPSQFTPHSRHNEGKAVDFAVEGVPNDVVRDFCRTLGAVGVGYYPHSSFVHLDVRSIATYWVDESGPGQSPQYSKAPGETDGASASNPRHAKPSKRSRARPASRPRSK